MSEHDEDPASEPSALDVVVARERAAPGAPRAVAGLGHAHGLRAILARERARAAARAAEASAGSLDAVA